MPVLLLLAVVVACNNSPDSPTAPPSTGFTLSGTITEVGSDTIIALVTVEITSGPSSGTTTTTDGAGNYSIPGLTGTVNIRFSKDGYVATGRTANMTQNVVLNLSLAREDTPPTPTFTLSGVVTRGQGAKGPIGRRHRGDR